MIEYTKDELQTMEAMYESIVQDSLAKLKDAQDRVNYHQLHKAHFSALLAAVRREIKANSEAETNGT